MDEICSGAIVVFDLCAKLFLVFSVEDRREKLWAGFFGEGDICSWRYLPSKLEEERKSGGSQKDR